MRTRRRIAAPRLALVLGLLGAVPVPSRAQETAAPAAESPAADAPPAEAPASAASSTEGAPAGSEPRPAAADAGARKAAEKRAPVIKPVPRIDATPTHWPLVPYRPGRPLPVLTTFHQPRGEPNTVDGKVWTQTLYTVSQPLGVEWGYGQVGTQLDVENLFGTPVGAHVDGFFQQRLWHRPLRMGLRAGFVYFEDDVIPVDGTQHARYLTYDRLTEANLQVRHRFFDVKVGRSIVPQAMQAFVDGVNASVSPLPWLRVGGFGGLMPDVWHPRMWMDANYRDVAGFLPAERGDMPTLQPVVDDAQRYSSRPLKFVESVLDGQTVFSLRSATVGGFASFRFARFTSDTSAQLILWNPALGYRRADDLRPPNATVLGLSNPVNTVPELVDAAYVNHVMTWRPVAPLNFRLQGSWDAWGAMRALDARRVSPDGNPVAALSDPVGFLDPLVDSSLGLRELLADVTLRGGDIPAGVSVQFHHFQSLVTAASYGFFQRDLLQPSIAGAVEAGQANPGIKPQPAQTLLVAPKVLNNQRLGTVQRERLRMSGWMRPWGFLARSASAQLYGEAYLEWRRDYPAPYPDNCVDEEERRVTPGSLAGTDALDNLTRHPCRGASGPRRDDVIRAAGTVGFRDPNLNDTFTYDLSFTAMDSWHNRAVVARTRVGAQAFNALYMDLGFTYEFSHNQRYFTSADKYDVTGARRTSVPLYPDDAFGQSIVLDASIMYRVAYGLTFDASYLLFFEEAPVVQDYILANGQAPAGIRGYIPRDTSQAQQLVLMRAVYRL